MNILKNNGLKPLYEVESTYTFDEYKKGVFLTNKHLHFRSNMQASLALSIGIFILLSAFEMYLMGLLLSLILFPVFWISGLAFKRYMLFSKIKKSYNSNGAIIGSVAKFRFFSDYVEISGHIRNKKSDDLKSLKFSYSEFNKIIETETNFYITLAKNEATFFLVKENCSFGLIAFIQDLSLKSK